MRLGLRSFSCAVGLSIASATTAADYSVVEAISWSSRFGHWVYLLRDLGLPGALASLILTGLIEGNLHAGGRNELAYHTIALLINATVYALITYWVFSGISNFFKTPGL